MKQFISGLIFTIAITLAVAVGPVTAKQGTDPCRGVTIKTLRQQVPIPPAAIVSKRQVNGMCEVILDIRGQYVPVYAGQGFVIAGEMFQDRTQVTQAAINRLREKKFISLKDEVEKCVAMTLKPKQGPAAKTVYMITDPVCPYCHRAETRLKEYADKYNTEFKVVFYSVHPPVGRQKAIEAVCRGLSAEQYLKGDWKKDNKTQGYQCQKGKDLVSRSEQLARKLGIRGVPMFYLSDGTLVQGANMRALAKILSGTGKKLSYAR